MSHSHSHVSFDDFFSSGMDESISPFLTASSRKWAFNHSLVSSIIAAVLLALSFLLSYINKDLSLVCLSFVFFLSGVPALIESIYDLKDLNINIDVLMTLAAFLSILIGSQMEGALLLVLFALSHAMEHMVTRKTKGALQSLHQISPTMGVVVAEDGTISQKSIREIQKGTKLLIQSGEVIPLDGVVKEGSSYVNLVHLTGESIPIAKHVNDEVQAGSLNLEGTLTIIVTKVAADSTLSKIIKLITQAQEAKPKLQRFLDKFSRAYATTIISLSAFFAIALPFMFGISFVGIEGSIYRALAFLIAASPCALIIATPTAYLSAISCVAKKGILLKGGVTLDALARCKLFAFDKTGTLTTGRLSCVKVDHLTTEQGKFDNHIAIQVAYTLERSSSHPIATAIIDYAQKKQIVSLSSKEIKSIPGYGVEGIISIDNAEIPSFIGSYDFIRQKLSDEQALDKAEYKEGHLVTYLMIGKDVFSFHFQDEIRESMKETIDDLHRLDLKSVMLTGDHKPNADYVASKLGIDVYEADLKPEEKLKKVTELAEEQGLAMIGDGINDAPSLARANVGISMGLIGSSTAIEASDIVFLNDDLRLLSWLYKKSKSTMRIVKQNLTLALGVIVLATTPALLGVIPLWLAVILHEGGTVIVGLNSLRLLRKN